MKNTTLLYIALGAVLFVGTVYGAAKAFSKQGTVTMTFPTAVPVQPLVSEPAMPDASVARSSEFSQEVTLPAAPMGSPVSAIKREETVPAAVVVAAPVAALSQEPSWCDGGDMMAQYDCYNKFYVGLVQSGGSTVAMEHIKAKYKAGNVFYTSQCHQLTHMVGRAATDAYKTVSEAYIHGDSFCWSGYYHGVMEGIVSKIGSDVANKLDSICADLPGKATYTFDYYNCVHGLGHGLMYILNDEVPESLKLCDNLTGWWEQTSCYGGVFMENVIADQVNHTSKYVNDDPQYPCSIVEEKYKGTCYLMQTSRMLVLANGDFAKVFKQCDDAPGAYRNICYQSLGRDASGRSISNAVQTKISCMFAHTDDALQYCFRGAVMDFISYYHSDVQARELCALLQEDLQSDCLLTTTDYYKRF